MSAAVTLGRETRIAHLTAAGGPPDPGGAVPAHAAFEVLGPAAAPVIVVLGGISAGRHVGGRGEGSAPGWWEAQTGPGRPLDTDRYRILGIDYVGGPGASAVCTTRTRRRRFCPRPEDQARAVAAALTAMGVARARLVVGASYGGAVALAFAEHYPDRVERLAVLCSAHRSHPMATALRSIQRRIVRRAEASESGSAGLALARALAMTTYRTAEEFEARFHGPPRWVDGEVRFPVDGYLDAHGERFAERFDAEAFLRLSESLDLADIDPARVTVPTDLWAVRGDALVPTWLVRELADRLGGPVRVVEVDSCYGHDAFLKEERAVSEFLRYTLISAPGSAPTSTVARAPGEGPSGEGPESGEAHP